jgi:hypothetical protein
MADSVKNNFKKLMNNLTGTKNQLTLKKGPTNFTHMDDNRVKMNVIEKPSSFFIETNSKETFYNKDENSPKQQENKSVNLNGFITNLSEEDANELTEILNKLPMFEELNKECDELLSPTNNNLNLIKKLQHLEKFESDMYENTNSAPKEEETNILNLEKENVSILVKQTVIKDEKGEDKDSVSNLTMESFTPSENIEGTSKTNDQENNKENDTQIDGNNGNNSMSSAKKKKKRNKKKK